MKDESIFRLARRWIELQSLPQDSPEAGELMPAAVEVNMLALKRPQECWDVVITVVNETDDEWVLSNLAAGPLESLLAQHSDKIIPLVAAEAANSDRFREILGTVWKNSITEDTWRRVQAARSV